MRFAPADIISDIFKENLIEQRKSDNSGRKKIQTKWHFVRNRWEIPVFRFYRRHFKVNIRRNNIWNYKSSIFFKS